MEYKRDNSTHCLRLRIRNGSEPDNHGLIEKWFAQDRCCETKSQPGVCHACPVSRQREHYEMQFHLLMDTALDELLPDHWREACLNQIYRPLVKLNQLATSKQGRMRQRGLMRELSTNIEYAKHSFYYLPSGNAADSSNRN